MLGGARLKQRLAEAAPGRWLAIQERTNGCQQLNSPASWRAQHGQAGG
jgi:hypothetical protein